MQEIVVSACFGGFGVSDEAAARLRAKGMSGHEHEWSRDDPRLVAVVKEMGEAASNRYSNLRVVEVPDGVEWEISEYDGFEHVAEKHRTWYAED